MPSPYIGYSRLVIGKNVGGRDRVCVLADYLSKPKATTTYHEVEVCKPMAQGHNPVFNACMLESHASLFIHVVDVLVGCVVFDFRMKLLAGFTPNHFKRQLVELVSGKLGVALVVEKLTRYKPNYFSVWPFKVG